jgi:outer membrane receptor for ferrienterochelin and colicin
MKLSKYQLLILLLPLFSFPLAAQKLSGTVHELDGNSNKNPLPGANVYWLETQQGIATDIDGRFELVRPSGEESNLIVSYIGYVSDTIPIEEGQQQIDVVLAAVATLGETVITGWQPGTFISRMDPMATEVITSKELLKAACCNLSESFETNASVDVNYSDAVTGAKTIQLLGLAGIYTQMMTENFPNLRGLASTFGLGYIPGPWMESIQVSKGASSVINGFESITGQINVEYKKPATSEKLYLNLFADHMGRVEANANAGVQINEQWSTLLFGHVEDRFIRDDMNHDSFMDQPLIRQYNLFNRWEYQGKKPWHIQLGIKLLDEDRTSGQMDFDPDKNTEEQPGIYGIQVDTRRYEGFSKVGRVLERRKETSFGLINNFTWHDQKSLIGLNRYEGHQVSWYSNYLFSTYIRTIDHKITTGASFSYDSYDEMYNDSSFARNEAVPGLFAEYSYNIHEKFTLLAGLRMDYNSIFGFFFTPRLHLKFLPDEHTTIRISLGKGTRTANVFAENGAVMASSRTIMVLEPLDQEQAWNFGINLSRHFELGSRELQFNADYYRTQFVNQVILDMDRDLHRAYFYNLDGRSYSNSFQAEAVYNPADRLDVTLAFRYNDVKATMNGELQRKPLVNRYKGLLSVSYKTRLNKWQFDVTTQLNGDSRLPDTQSNPEEYRRENKSPVYVLLNAQVSKFFRRWDVYAGVENLTNFTQHDPVIAADDPFGLYFDASMVWGPIVGRKFYAGIRFRI